MNDSTAPHTTALRDLYWRSEILQVMYWLRGEGLGEFVDPPLLERFLGVEVAVSVSYLDRLVDEGYLERTDSGFSLSDKGVQEAGSEFALSFADLTRPAHGECSDDCWCHLSLEEAEACFAEQSGHSH